MKFSGFYWSPFLLFYRIVWGLALPLAQIMAELDGLLRKIFQRGILPLNWHVTQRIKPWVKAKDLERTGPCLWLHCASLGESKGLWALAKQNFASLRPFRIVLTCNTHTGLNFLIHQVGDLIESDPQARNRIHALIAPADHPKVIGRFIQKFGIKSLCLYESEIWPHYIRVSREQALAVSMVSARMSEKAFKLYRRFPLARQALLNRISWIQAQGHQDQKRFLALGSGPCRVGFDFKAAYYLQGGGNPKHGSSHDPVQSPLHLPARRPRITFVSLHARELNLLYPELPGLMERFDITLIPRHLQEVGKFLKILEPIWKNGGFNFLSKAEGEEFSGHCLVNTLGLVRAILEKSQIAFVGGSLIPVGGHNLWEPLMAGLKIYFGAFLGNQQGLAQALIERKIGEPLINLAQVREWKIPGPEVSIACRKFVQDQKLDLETALQECRERLIATLEPQTK